MENQTNADDDSIELPTATEFIPADMAGAHHDEAMVRKLQLVRDGKGVEVVNIEPCQGEPPVNNVYVCDGCGQSETLETDIEHHLRTEHRTEAEAEADE
jgi:Fe-S cluster biogenesis protein NfuA